MGERAVVFRDDRARAEQMLLAVSTGADERTEAPGAPRFM
jgi:hypothetical protein